MTRARKKKRVRLHSLDTVGHIHTIIHSHFCEFDQQLWNLTELLKQLKQQWGIETPSHVFFSKWLGDLTGTPDPLRFGMFSGAPTTSWKRKYPSNKAGKWRLTSFLGLAKQVFDLSNPIVPMVSIIPIVQLIPLIPPLAFFTIDVLRVSCHVARESAARPWMPWRSPDSVGKKGVAGKGGCPAGHFWNFWMAYADICGIYAAYMLHFPWKNHGKKTLKTWGRSCDYFWCPWYIVNFARLHCQICFFPRPRMAMSGLFPPLTKMCCVTAVETTSYAWNPHQWHKQKKQQIQGWQRDTPGDSRMHGCKMTNAGPNAYECILSVWMCVH